MGLMEYRSEMVSQTTAIFQALAEKGARRRESEIGFNDVRVDEN